MGKNYFERVMKKIPTSALCVLCITMYLAFAGPAVQAATTGTALLKTEGRTYPGTYSTADKLVSFDIDGLVYRGYYASHAEDGSRTSGGTSSGKWGRAFLFASSAKILRCQLDSAFPKATGECQGADGRVFRLTTGTQQKTASVPKGKAEK